MQMSKRTNRALIQKSRHGCELIRAVAKNARERQIFQPSAHFLLPTGRQNPSPTAWRWTIYLTWLNQFDTKWRTALHFVIIRVPVSGIHHQEPSSMPSAQLLERIQETWWILWSSDLCTSKSCRSSDCNKDDSIFRLRWILVGTSIVFLNTLLERIQETWIVKTYALPKAVGSDCDKNDWIFTLP